MLFLFSLNISFTSSTLYKTNPLDSAPTIYYHKLRIINDYINIEKYKIKFELIKIFNEVSAYLSNFFYVSTIPEKIHLKKLEKCRKNYFNKLDKSLVKLFDRYCSNCLPDLIVFPVFADKAKIKITNKICTRNKNKFANTALIIISPSLKSKKDLTTDEINTLKFFIIRSYLKFLGFNKKSLESRNIINNFLNTESSLTENMLSRKSSEKYHSLCGFDNFTNIYDEEDKTNNTYLSLWPERYSFKDLMRNKESSLYFSNTLSEVTLNLLKELPYLAINKCDLFYFRTKYINALKPKCYRFDKKCLPEEDINKYFINYEFYQEKQKPICYLNTAKNLLNQQCGILTGNLVFSEADFCFSTRFYELSPNEKEKTFKKNKLIKTSKITKKIKLLLPDKRCGHDQPRTVFFNNDFIDRKKLEKWLNDNNRTIIEKEIDNPNFFLRYKIFESKFYKQAYSIILSENNFIKNTREGDWLISNLFFPDFKTREFFLDSRLNSPFLKIGLFTGHDQITYKDLLYKNYFPYQKMFPEDYNFIPESYIYPTDVSTIYQLFKDYNISSANKDNLWLLKPSRGSLGQGIHLFKTIRKSIRKYNGQFILTRYISEPHLLYNTKYDLRVYVLVTSLAPLKIYLYKEGLVRRASAKYSLKDRNNLFIHLTNVAVNKKNKKGYKPSQDSDSEEYGKWSFKTYEKYLQKKYPERPGLYDFIRSQIADIAIKSLIATHKKIWQSTRGKYDSGNFYQIFGFDILVDKNFKCYVLEINNRPQMSLGDKVDQYVKLRLITDTFNIIGFVPFNAENRTQSLDMFEKEEEEKKYNNNNIDNNKESNSRNKNDVEKAAEDSFCEFYRPTGYFDRIFPLKNNIEKYKKFFQNRDNEYNTFLWEKIMNSTDKFITGN